VKDDSVVLHKKIGGRVALSLLPNGTKTCFVFFVHDQYSASFLATWISAILETGMNQCPGAYTDEKF